MEARTHAALEDRIALAWHVENFAGLGRNLKPLGHYLARLKGGTASSPGDLLATLRELKARGAPMNIKKVES